LEARSERDFDSAFLTLVKLRAGALVISADVNDHRDQIIALASRYSVPTIYEWREAVMAGGLISCGTGRENALRQNGILVGRILKGEKPSDLPVLRASKFELVINHCQSSRSHHPAGRARQRRRGNRIAAFCCDALCPLLAQSGHPDALNQCPLLG
jgi:hypothetical protein